MTKSHNIDNRLIQIESIHKILVPHTNLASIRDDIEETIKTHQAMIKSSTSDDRSTFSRNNNICLFGESGTGKTTMCNSILKKYHKHTIIQNGFSINIVPTFYTSLPSPITMKGCPINLLKELGVYSEKPNTQSLTFELLKLLNTAQTNLIILDEFDHLIKNENALTVRNWVKYLINNAKIPILLVGTPSFESLINADKQISSRFTMRRTLSNFPYNPIQNDNTSMQNFIKSLTKTYAYKLGLDSMPDFNSKKDLMAMYLSTGGSPDSIATLLKITAKQALKKGKNSVLMEDLKQSDPTVYLPHRLISKSHNPFNMSLEEMCRLHVTLKAA